MNPSGQYKTPATHKIQEPQKIHLSMFGKKEEEMEAADKYETARNNCHTQNTRLQKIHSKF